MYSRSSYLSPRTVGLVLQPRDAIWYQFLRQQLWARRVELPVAKGKAVDVACIVAREIDAPSGIKLVEWRLLINRESATAAAVVELVDWYRARWEIEILFNVLKNGCRVEALQLGAIERIERSLALYLVVSWAHRLSDACRMYLSGP